MAIKDFQTPIDWYVVDDILTNEMFEELPILALDQTHPTLAAYAEEYPNYEDVEPEDIVKDYFQLITSRDIVIEDTLVWTEALEEVAKVQDTFFVVRDILEAIGVKLKITLGREDMSIKKVSYDSHSDSTLPLDKDIISKMKDLGCSLSDIKENEITFTDPLVINWFNKAIARSLEFHQEKIEESLETIIYKTQRRINKDDVYLVD